MKNKLIMKELVLGIIMLFIGTGFFPLVEAQTSLIQITNKAFDLQWKYEQDMIVPDEYTLLQKALDRISSSEYIHGQLIVKLKKDATISKHSIFTLNQKHKVYACEKVFLNAENTILDNIYLLHVPIQTNILSVVHDYKSCSEVIYAEPNFIGHISSIPNDVNFTNQWYLHNTGQIFWGNISGTIDADIDAPEAWNMEIGRSDVVIAIIDTGIDYTHPDLMANIWQNIDEIPGNNIDDDHNSFIDDVRGWDFYYNDNDPKDEFGHGTACAGVAGAVTDNSIGIAGVCWKCKIMPVKISNYQGHIPMFILARGISYAVDNGANVISMSLGSRYKTQLIRDVVTYAYDKGVYLCAAVGNSDTWKKYYPAAFDQVTAVAATNQNDRRCTPKEDGFGSNYGTWVDIAAPGSFIYTALPTYEVTMNLFGLKQYYDNCGGGTSFSAPMVAGVAALLLSEDPSLSPYELKAILCGNVDAYNSSECIGTGRLNAQKALACLLSEIKIDIKGGRGIEVVFSNDGLVDATDVEWHIHVNGGLLGLIDTTVNGTIDIKAGGVKTVTLPPHFGLGGIIISARTDSVSKTVKGKQFFTYSLVMK